MRLTNLFLVAILLVAPFIAEAATEDVYPFGQKEVTVPAAQYINVFHAGSGKVYVYKQVGGPSGNTSKKFTLETSGEFDNEERVFGPYTNATMIRIQASADGALYSVGEGAEAIPVSRLTPGALTAGAASSATGTGIPLVLTSGAGGSTSGASGAVTIASGTATANSGSASGALLLKSGAGAVSTGTTAGGASGTVTLRSGAGGENQGTGIGGAAGTFSIIGGAGGNTSGGAAGAGAPVAITAGAGGAASAGTGNGGAGGTIRFTSGAGGSSAGGTAGVDGFVALTGLPVFYQGAPNTQTTNVSLTAADLLTQIIVATPAAAVQYTLPTGAALDAATQLSVGDAFDCTIINVATNAAYIITVMEPASGITITGVATVPSASATTGALHGATARFRFRKTATDTFIAYRMN